MNVAVIGLGSNIRPSENIRLARQKIDRSYKVIKESRLIKTKPVGFLSQPDFINGVIVIETIMKRSELESWLKSVEKSQGRIHLLNKNGPRTIDLDILIWNNKIVDKEVYGRDFLKACIREVCPDMEIP